MHLPRLGRTGTRATEARMLGICFAKDAEDEEINDELLTLLDQYNEMLQIDSPFDGQGELIETDSEE